MNIAKNLQYLRKRDRITQEDLADKLGVSRQSVSKWETGEAYPETDKLLTLCDLFNVSLDALMRGDIAAEALEATADKASAPEEREDQPEKLDPDVFYKHVDKFSRGISLGAALIIFGVAMCVLLAGVSFTLAEPYSELTAIMGGVAVILFVAPALFLFIYNGMNDDRFRKAHPVISIEANDRAAAFQKKFAVAIACLVSGILVDVVFLVVMSALIGTGIIAATNVDQAQCFVTAAFLGMLSFTIGGLVYFGIQHSKYNVDIFNKQSRMTNNRSSRQKLASTVCGIIMMSAAAIYIVIGFVWNWWHPGWVIFPVGGLLCGIINTALGHKDQE